MVSTLVRSRRLGAAALTALVLVGVAGCTSEEPAPPAPAAPTSAPTMSAAPGPKQTPKATLPPPATTPVPQKSPGDVGSEVPTQPEKSQPPVALGKPSDAGGGVSARITDTRSIRAKAVGAGEVSGPALALTVRVTNGSKSRLDLNQVVVTLAGRTVPLAGRSPASPLILSRVRWPEAARRAASTCSRSPRTIVTRSVWPSRSPAAAPCFSTPVRPEARAHRPRAGSSGSSSPASRAGRGCTTGRCTAPLERGPPCP